MPKREEREDRQAGLGADRRREGGASADRFADEDRRRLVEIDAAEFFRHVGADEAERSRLGDELARQRPVFLLEALDRRA